MFPRTCDHTGLERKFVFLETFVYVSVRNFRVATFKYQDCYVYLYVLKNIYFTCSFIHFMLQSFVDIVRVPKPAL